MNLKTNFFQFFFACMLMHSEQKKHNWNKICHFLKTNLLFRLLAFRASLKKLRILEKLIMNKKGQKYKYIKISSHVLHVFYTYCYLSKLLQK